MTFPLYDGIDELKSNVTLTVSPNPLTKFTRIKINGPSDQSSSIVIYSTMGQIIKSIPVGSSNEVMLEKSDLTAGIYILQLQSNGQSRAAEKLIVE